MAKSIGFLLLVLLALTLLQETAVVLATQGGHHHKRNHYGPGSLKSFRGAECPSECARRCGKTQYHKPCTFFCQKCCNKCLCVPPGYYGNKAICPCYNNWKTKRGGPKCP